MQIKKNVTPLPPPSPLFFLFSLQNGQERNWHLKRREYGSHRHCGCQRGANAVQPTPFFRRFLGLYVLQKLNSAQNCNSIVFELMKAVGRVYLLFILMNSKNKNRRIFILFSPFYSAHSASFIKFPPFMRGGVLLILKWETSPHVS